MEKKIFWLWVVTSSSPGFFHIKKAKNPGDEGASLFKLSESVRFNVHSIMLFALFVDMVFGTYLTEAQILFSGVGY